MTGFIVVTSNRRKLLRNSSLSTKTDLTLHSRLVPFEDVDVILQLSELFLHSLKNRFNFLVWPCIEAVVDVFTMLCG